MTMTTKAVTRAGALAACFALAACGSILDVESAGRIEDDDLNDPDAVPGIVVGISSDLMEAYDATLDDVSLAALELWHGGSYDYADIPRGIITPEDVNGEWAEMQQARWVAEQGIMRIAGMEAFADQFEDSPFVARAYLLAGLSNRLLGESVCTTAIDGGPELPNTEHFVRADSLFTRAIQIGTAAGDEDIVAAAYGGRASVRAWQGQWAAAAQDAQQVPSDFAYMVLFGTEDDNDIHFETYSRPEYTVWNTEFEDHPDDPRAPWHIFYLTDGSVRPSANGADPFYQQEKYDETGADVPAVKGTEMLLLRAEAALVQNPNATGIAEAVGLMNSARDEFGMTPLSPTPATLDEAWDALFYERGATLWMEGRRLWDFRRWWENTGPAHNDWRQSASPDPQGTTLRDVCIPISENERRANPNFD